MERTVFGLYALFVIVNPEGKWISRDGHLEQVFRNTAP